MRRWVVTGLSLVVGAAAGPCAPAQRLNLGDAGPPELGGRSVLLERSTALDDERAGLEAQLSQLESGGAGRDRVLSVRTSAGARSLCAALLRASAGEAADPGAALAGLTLLRGLGPIDDMAATHAAQAEAARSAPSPAPDERIRWARGREALMLLVQSMRDAEAAIARGEADRVPGLVRRVGRRLVEADAAVRGAAPARPPAALQARLDDLGPDRLLRELTSIGLSEDAAGEFADLAVGVAWRDALAGDRSPARPSLLLREVLGLVAAAGDAAWIETPVRSGLIELLESSLAPPDGGPGRFWGNAAALVLVGRSVGLLETLELERPAGRDAEAAVNELLRRAIAGAGRGRVAHTARLINRALRVSLDRRGLADWREAPRETRRVRRILEQELGEIEAAVMAELPGLAALESTAVSPSVVSLLVRHADAVDALSRLIGVDATIAALGATGEDEAKALAQRLTQLKASLAPDPDERDEIVAEVVTISKAVERFGVLPGERLLARSDPAMDRLCDGASVELLRIVRKERGAVYQALATGGEASAARASAERLERLLEAMLVARAMADEDLLRALGEDAHVEAPAGVGRLTAARMAEPLGRGVEAALAGDANAIAGALADLERSDGAARALASLARVTDAAGARPGQPPAASVGSELAAGPAWWTAVGAHRDDVAAFSRWLAEWAHADDRGAGRLTDDVAHYVHERGDRLAFQLETTRVLLSAPTVSPELPGSVEDAMP